MGFRAKGSGWGLRRGSCFAACVLVILLAAAFTGYSAPQNDLEGRTIREIVVAFEGRDRDTTAFEQFRSIAAEKLGKTYSAVNIRSAIAALYSTERIVSVIVEAERVGAEAVDLRFVIKRKSRVSRVSVNLTSIEEGGVTEAEILLRLNLLSPGSTVSQRVLEENADAILTYLRVRGYYEAEVDYTQIPKPDQETEVEITFNVMPGTQARVGEFEIAIDKLSESDIRPELGLKSGDRYSLPDLNRDVETVRAVLGTKGYLAPAIDESRIYDSDRNLISITITGTAGPLVEVSVDAGDVKLSEKKKTELLPVMREGTLDYSAIVEGERRLENYFQRQGFFFARVTPYCSVEPAFSADEASVTENGTEELCTALTGASLEDRTVKLKYDATLRLRLRLEEIRIEGTDLFTTEDVLPILESREASIIGIIPYLGYGRGYTSLDLLEKDRIAILTLLRELGYREAEVGVRQGASLDSKDLLITFEVIEGRLTKISEVGFVGNKRFPEAELLELIPDLAGGSYSRARVRNAERKLSQFYADRGYFEAEVTASIDAPNVPVAGEFDQVKVIFTVTNEGRPVVVSRVLVNGAVDTKESAIRKAIDLKPGALLRQTDIFSSEQNLFASDAFEQVQIKQELVGQTPDGTAAQSDILVSLTEKPPRLITYGGGYSTDVGLSGFFDIRHFNLLGQLYQGGAQVRVSQRQQLVQFDFIDPRFIPDGKDRNGKKQFAPLTLSAQYQRDTTVTRFFRSTFDQGTFGIVQRVDENGNPIDEFGNSAGDPTINRFSISLETNRTISRKDRSILFVRYRFEDVRLFNFESLLIKELLRPDAKIRISGFSATFVRDTRKDCQIEYTLLDLVNKGEPGEPCRYSSGDPTEGGYLTAEYKFSAPALGANIGFHKFQLTYNRYFTVKALNNTTFAGRAIIGVADVFAGGDRFEGTEFPGLSGSLPISERFFAGGSTTLRGFDFETAGPRVVVVPEGTFRNQQGEEITLNPFTIPFGGNALAIANLEARIPFTRNLRVVPFYDGGNVFTKSSEIFNPSNETPGDPFLSNLRSVWTHTVGLGFRIKTPVGGEFAVDYGYLLNPPKFIIPSDMPPDGVFRLYQGQFHFRFSQAF